MSSYLALYESLGIPAAAARLARGDVPWPRAVEVGPLDSYGFPPALLPLWADSISTVGYWHHWFTDRRLTIVTFNLEAGHCWEEARSFEQLALQVVLDRLESGRYTDAELEGFLKACGVRSTLDDVKAVADVAGDDPAGLYHLPEYDVGVPVDCYQGTPGYRGGFPFVGMAKDARVLRTLCTRDCCEPVLAEIAQHPAAPPWFRAASQRPLFDELLAAGDLAGAWMSLNSTGWHRTDAGEAALALAGRARDPLFKRLMEAWANQPHHIDWY